jgi:hypothetical protein
MAVGVVRILVSSAGSANGGGYGAILSFDSEGEPLGPFSADPLGRSLRRSPAARS